MAASKSNYTILAATGKTIKAQWPDLHSLLGGWVALLQSLVRNGTEPDDAIRGFIFGTTARVNAWRVYYDGVNLLVQENTGTDPSPTWTTRDTFVFSLGLALDASRIISGSFANARISQASVIQHEAAITHDNLIGGGGNKHIDHSLIQITAGAGLTGGGTLVASRSLALASSGVTPGAYAGDATSFTVDTYGRITATSALPAADDKWKDTDADVSGIVGTEQLVQFASPDVGEGISFPGADGAKDYYVEITLPLYVLTSAWEGELRLHVGTLGTTGDAVSKTRIINQQSVNAKLPFTWKFKIVDPGASDVLSVGFIRTSGTGTLTVQGATSPGSLHIYRVP